MVLHVERAVSTFKVNAKTSEEKRKVDKLEAFDALRRESAAEAANAADADWVDPSVTARRRGGLGAQARGDGRRHSSPQRSASQTCL